ncbi:antirestriction protein [Paracoccus sp. 22332]|uniref:antirestriction protein n=1 Tax=Paracoccus sp. 22332 TaxID=3453913 RepID=UPI003F8616D5
MSMTTPAFTPATPVAEHRRMVFLPRLFGPRLFLIGEQAVFGFMEKLSPADYTGGIWDFCERAGQPLYLAPTSRPRFHLVWDGNGYEGDVSADAAGIIATLFAFSHLSFRHDAPELTDGFARLYAHAADHPEAREIFQAID